MLPYRIIHDYLQVNGGAERLVTTLTRSLPGARLGVSGVFADFASADTHGVAIDDWGQAYRWLPRLPRALAVFTRPPKQPLQAATVVYSGVFAPLAARHQRGGRRVYYCHTPPRFAFDREQEYLRRLPAFAGLWLRPLLARYRRAYLRALRSMDVVLVNSQHVRQRLLEQTGIQAEVVHPPIDTRGLRYLGQGDYYLSLGRLEPNKRVERVVRAFLDMPERQLLVASGGSQLAALRALAANAANIRFTGWLDDASLAQLMGNAIATLYVPRDEDFGMSAIESMAAGKPVIGVDEGGLREGILDGVTGLLLPADPSVADIATAVQRLDSTTAAGMRAACEARAAQFSTEHFLERFHRSIACGANA